MRRPKKLLKRLMQSNDKWVRRTHSQNGLAFALYYRRMLLPTYQGTMRLQSLPPCGWLKTKEESDGKVNWRKRKKKEDPQHPRS